MAEGLDLVYETIDRQHAGESAHTRRRLVAGAAAALGGMGLLALPGVAGADPATPASFPKENTPERILTVAATAEVLATIVNTGTFGAKALTKQIWIPDAVFADRTSFLSTLEVGDQIFCNAYLIGTAAFGFAGLGQQAVVAAEFMGVEAVHRALARQSLGKLGNDRVFIRADNREEAPDAPNPGQLGFNHIGSAVTQLQAAGFGFGAKGAEPGSFYSFEEVRRRTPDDPDVNTRFPDQIRA